jgi:hypothetical protein
MGKVELAILRRAKRDAEQTRKEVLRYSNSPGLQAAIREIDNAAGSLQAAITTRDARFEKIAELGRRLDGSDSSALAEYRPTSQWMLEEQRESRALLNKMLEVLTAVLETQRQEASAIISLERESLKQGRWAPWVFGVAFIAMLAAVVGLVLPIVT